MAMKKKYVKKAPKRYKKKPSNAALVNRVKKIEDNFKPEKKHIQFTPYGQDSQQFAQSSTLAYPSPGGCAYVDLVPPISNGTLVTDRTGNKVNPTGCMIDFMIRGDTLLVNRFQYKVHFIRMRDNQANESLLTLVGKMMERNPFSPGQTAIDWHSRRDMEYMRQFQIIKTVSGTLEPDSLSGQIGYSQRKVALRMPKDFRWNYNNTVDIPTTDRFFALVVGDTGVISLNTGGIFQISIKWFYLDQ